MGQCPLMPLLFDHAVALCRWALLWSRTHSSEDGYKDCVQLGAIKRKVPMNVLRMSAEFGENTFRFSGKIPSHGLLHHQNGYSASCHFVEQLFQELTDICHSPLFKFLKCFFFINPEMIFPEPQSKRSRSWLTGRTVFPPDRIILIVSDLLKCPP
jgi:hypothetical protein